MKRGVLPTWFVEPRGGENLSKNPERHSHT